MFVAGGSTKSCAFSNLRKVILLCEDGMGSRLERWGGEKPAATLRFPPAWLRKEHISKMMERTFSQILGEDAKYL